MPTNLCEYIVGTCKQPILYYAVITNRCHLCKVLENYKFSTCHTAILVMMASLLLQEHLIAVNCIQGGATGARSLTAELLVNNSIK